MEVQGQLHFITAKNRNGQRKYFGIDLEKKRYARSCSKWVDSDWPEVKVKDMEKIAAQLDACGFVEVEYV